MILKIITCKDDNQETCYQISTYYTECGNYLEADLEGNGPEGAEIVLQDGKCLEDSTWEEIAIYTDNMIEILKIKRDDK